MEKLFAITQKLKLKILSLCRGELAAPVNTSTQMFHNAVVAVDARDGLSLCHEMRVAILMLPCRRNQYHTLEI